LTSRPALALHAQEAFGEGAVVPLHPMEVLSHEVFFTSPRLAALAIQAEVAEVEQHKEAVTAEVLQVGRAAPSWAAAGAHAPACWHTSPKELAAS
jgi:hypothetical protein